MRGDRVDEVCLVSVSVRLQTAFITVEANAVTPQVWIWRRGWDSDHLLLLKTQNLTDFRFRTIC